MLKIALLATLLVACVSDVHDTAVVPTAAPERLQAWTATVQRALDIWQASVGDDCQIPIYIGESGPSIHLIDPAAWTMPDKSGYYFRSTGEIIVRDDDAKGVLILALHELGHAMGLAHRDDVSSVMEQTPERGTMPNATDVAMLRAAIGCAAE